MKGDEIIMAEEKVINKNYQLRPMLIGLISFLISGVIAGLISLKTNEGLILILGTPIGSFIMLLLLRRKVKGKILSVIFRSLFGGFGGFFIGFMAGSILSQILGNYIPLFRELGGIKAQILPNIVTLIIADAIYGSLMASSLCEKKPSIRSFASVCAIASIPFGILLSLPIKMAWIGFDQNLLFTLLSFGTTAGLAISLYKEKAKKK